MFKIFNADKWRFYEPLEMDPEQPQRFERVCIRAFAEGAISESKAFELLGKTVRELVENLDKPPEEHRYGDHSGA